MAASALGAGRVGRQAVAVVAAGGAAARAAAVAAEGGRDRGEGDQRGGKGPQRGLDVGGHVRLRERGFAPLGHPPAAPPVEARGGGAGAAVELVHSLLVRRLGPRHRAEAGADEARLDGVDDHGLEATGFELAVDVAARRGAVEEEAVPAGEEPESDGGEDEGEKGPGAAGADEAAAGHCGIVPEPRWTVAWRARARSCRRSGITRLEHCPEGDRGEGSRGNEADEPQTGTKSRLDEADEG